MPFVRTLLVPCLLLFGLLLPATSRADGGLRPLGMARVDVTPGYPVRMTGYSSRLKEFEGVEQHIWAKALAIDADGQGAAVLITVDSLGIPQSMTDEVAARLKSKHGIEPEKVVICASHTHCAPGLANVAPTIFEHVTPEQKAHMQQYGRDLTDKLEQVALAALADRKPGRLSWSQGSADFAMNRRLLRDGIVRFGSTPWPAGPVDHALPVLRVTDSDGKLRGIVANYACHCTTLGGLFNRVCGDWAGFAQEIIEREHPGAIAMISIGCGADANPQPRDEIVYARLHGQTIAREVNRLLEGAWKPLDQPLLARRTQIELPFDTLPTREEFETRAKHKGPIAWHAKAQLARLDRGEKLQTHLPYTIGMWAIGDQLALVFLAGEVVVDYDLRLKREDDGRRLWVTAYANDDPCYIASKRVLAEGGYEVDSSMYYYDRPTHFAPTIEDQIIHAIDGLLPAAYKKSQK
ncbi:MAG TPA: neutral/alkaline non-lysosomal ceramidase N-terminal domain-containing protein [Pirellulales bacterium]|nr:neutral/alkaline non-lysosomal ceramidase N-terminal domain-containing protein [Pirellulales bacterium]